MKINFKKLIINILGSAVVTVRDEVVFVAICEDLGFLEVIVASVCVEALPRRNEAFIYSTQ